MGIFKKNLNFLLILYSDFTGFTAFLLLIVADHSYFILLCACARSSTSPAATME